MYRLIYQIRKNSESAGFLHKLAGITQVLAGLSSKLAGFMLKIGPSKRNSDKYTNLAIKMSSSINGRAHFSHDSSKKRFTTLSVALPSSKPQNFCLKAVYFSLYCLFISSIFVTAPIRSSVVFKNGPGASFSKSK